MMSDWPKVKIGSLGRVVTGKTPSTANRQNFGSDYPFITIPDLRKNVYITRSERELSEIGAKAVRGSILPENAVMMSCIATVGECGITTKPSVTNQQINSVICNDHADPQFIYYCFTQLGQEMNSAGAGGSIYTNVSKSRFSAIEVDLPPLPEQRAIASILGALDDKIDLNRRMNETLEAMASAIFKSWFVDFDPVRAKAEGKQPFGIDADTAALFPDRLVDSEIGPIPEGWEVSALGNLCDLVKDKTEPEDVDPETIYVGLEHIPKRSFSMLEIGVATDVSSAKTRFSPGDTLFGKLRPYFHKVVPAFTDGICSTDILALRPKSALHSAATLLTASLDACVDYATQYSTGTRMPRANWRDLAKFPIAMSTDLLPFFARQADTKINLIAHNVEQSRTLAELRDLLLPKLLSGEIRVKEAEKIVEDAV